MDEDNLYSRQQFVESCDGPGPSTSGCPGTHLTPAYFRLGLDEFELPEEVRGMARDFTGSTESAPFGDEEHANELVDEVCKWILGEEPSRPAHWKATQATTRLVSPELTGTRSK